jgi:hypothetical protein
MAYDRYSGGDPEMRVGGLTQERNSSGPRLEVNGTLFLSSDQRGYDRR